MSHSIKVSIIGCGMIAGTHLTALRNAGAEVAGVFDQNRETASAFASSHGIRSYDSMEALLADDTALVSVCTPSGTHAVLAETILTGGKHAVVEKPMALTVPECRRILDAERKTGRFCAPVSQFRFSDAYRQAKDAVETGLFGRMILGTLSMKYYREPAYYAGSWRGTKRMDGGGALMNQGIHGIDMMFGLMGYPSTVTGHAATLLHDIEVEDTAVAGLVFPSGALGVIDGSTAVVNSKPRRLELCGTRASMTIVEDSIESVEGMPLLPSAGTDCSSCRDPGAIGVSLHERQFRNILAAAAGEEPLYYSSYDAMRTVAAINAVYTSSRTGAAVVPDL